MRQKIYMLLLTLTTLSLFCDNAFCISKEIILKGNVKNNTSGFWEFGLTSFYGQEIISVNIDKNGNFLKKVSLSAPQDIFISIGNGISFFVVPDDKLTLTWDDNDVNKTFKIVSNSKDRQNEIELVYRTELKYRERFSNLFTDMRSKELSDDEKFNKVNSVFKDHIANITKSGKPSLYAEKVIADIYFIYTINFLETLNEKSKGRNYSFTLNDLLVSEDWQQFKSIDTVINNERLFNSSDLYRVFVSNKVRSFKPSGYVFKIASSGQHDTPVRYAMAGEELIKSEKLLNWYLTNSIFSSYSQYDFENAERAYQLYAHKVTDPVFSDTLKRFHDNISRLRPGTLAPNFKLSDMSGKDVQLSDFVGKVVYIDFWGIYCGPCLAEIQDYSPTLVKKYGKQNIVFLNICIDTFNKDDWKKKVKDLNFEGVNLIAPEYLNSTVVKDYFVGGIPRYVLIDVNGKIISATASRPSSLVRKSNNEIDKALR